MVGWKGRNFARWLVISSFPLFSRNRLSSSSGQSTQLALSSALIHSVLHAVARSSSFPPSLPHLSPSTRLPLLREAAVRRSSLPQNDSLTSQRASPRLSSSFHPFPLSFSTFLRLSTSLASLSPLTFLRPSSLNLSFALLPRNNHLDPFPPPYFTSPSSRSHLPTFFRLAPARTPCCRSGWSQSERVSLLCSCLERWRSPSPLSVATFLFFPFFFSRRRLTSSPTRLNAATAPSSELSARLRAFSQPASSFLNDLERNRNPLPLPRSPSTLPFFRHLPLAIPSTSSSARPTFSPAPTTCRRLPVVCPSFSFLVSRSRPPSVQSYFSKLPTTSWHCYFLSRSGGWTSEQSSFFRSEVDKREGRRTAGKVRFFVALSTSGGRGGRRLAVPPSQSRRFVVGRRSGPVFCQSSRASSASSLASPFTLMGDRSASDEKNRGGGEKRL